MGPETSGTSAAPEAGGPVVTASRWLWPLAGLLGGACAGMVDALVAVIRGVGGLGAVKAVWLVLIGTSLLGLVGLGAATALALVNALVQRARRSAAPGTAHGRRRRAAQITAALATLPFWIYDSVALFRGHHAAQLPGHQVVSLLLVAAGAAAVFRGAGWFIDVVARREAAGTPPPAARRRAQLAVLALIAVGAAAYAANRELLPRLYLWFHTTLSLVSVTSVVLAARLWLVARAGAGLGVGGGHVVREPPVGRRLAVLSLLAVAIASAGIWQLRRSQILRFASYERTAIAGLMLRAVPLSLAPRTVAASEREAAEAEPAAAARGAAPPRRRRPR